MDGKEKTRCIHHVPPLLRVDDLLGEDAGDTEHGPAGVDELGGTVPGHGARLGAETDGIKSAVPSNAAVEVGRRGGSREPERPVGSPDGDTPLLRRSARGRCLQRYCREVMMIVSE